MLGTYVCSTLICMCTINYICVYVHAHMYIRMYTYVLTYICTYNLHFGKPTKVSQKTFINYLMPECSLVPKSYSLFPYFL